MLTHLPFWPVIFFSVLLFASCKESSVHDHGDHADNHSADSHHDNPRGPHRGRLFTEGNFAVELQIFETEEPPQFRIFAYENNKQIANTDFTATVTLHRLSAEPQKFAFHPVGDFLTSDTIVSEPHSFAAEVTANFAGTAYLWKFESYEGRTIIPADVAEISGIKTEPAVSRDINTTLQLRGKVVPNEHKVAHIIPRFSGMVREGRKHIGDSVEKGETLAIIESNESLQSFEVRSQIAGTVINGHLVVGEFHPADQWAYIVADLAEVWVDLFVPANQRSSIHIGQTVNIADSNQREVTQGTVSYIAPYVDSASQSQLVRAVVKNEKGRFPPGIFVTGDLVVETSKVGVAVKKSALQYFRDWQVVFIKVGDTYEVAPVTLGRADGDWVEVIEGLKPNQMYVTENSYLIKADILKSGASHDH